MRIRCLVIALFSFFLVNCASYDFARRTVKQGNLLPIAKVSKLSVGMSKKEVANIMGSSLLGPIFNLDRWDYAYTQRKGNGTLHVQRLVLFFQNGQLEKIQKSV